MMHDWSNKFKRVPKVIVKIPKLLKLKKNKNKKVKLLGYPTILNK